MLCIKRIHIKSTWTHIGTYVELLAIKLSIGENKCEQRDSGSNNSKKNTAKKRERTREGENRKSIFFSKKKITPTWHDTIGIQSNSVCTGSTTRSHTTRRTSPIFPFHSKKNNISVFEWNQCALHIGATTYMCAYIGDEHKYTHYGGILINKNPTTTKPCIYKHIQIRNFRAIWHFMIGVFFRFVCVLAWIRFENKILQCFILVFFRSVCKC